MFKFAMVFCGIMLLCTGARAQGIVSLAPHLTEWVYLLKQQRRLLAVSEFSDYPDAAKALPTVANHQGVNLEKILALQPELILAWRGGNKPQDLSRLEALGFELFYSSPKSPLDIADELTLLGERLGVRTQAELASTQLRDRWQILKTQYQSLPTLKVFYYVWTSPLMTAGSDPWVNSLLAACGVQNVFGDLPQSYPEVPLESVLRQGPQRIIGVVSLPREQQVAFWRPWLSALNLSEKDLVLAPSERLNRFSPRLFDDLETLCQQLRYKP